MISTVAVGLYIALSHCAHAADSEVTTVLQGKGGPSVPSIITIPAHNVGEAVTATASGSLDPDDDPISYEFRWCTGVNGTGTSCLTGATQTFSDQEIRYVQVRALTPRGYPQATQGSSPWSADVTTQAYGTAPTATGLTISGTEEVNATLTGTFTYFDADGDAAGTHTYQWYRADDSAGTTNKAAIGGATGESYTVQLADRGKFLVWEVTPKSATGNPSQGVAASIVTANSVPTANTVVVPGVGTFAKPDGTYRTWSDANSYCNDLVSGGASDWRLPTRAELVSFYNAYPNNKIKTVLGWPTNDVYWSSTVYSAGTHYIVNLSTGNISAGPDSRTVYVTCVR